MYAFLYLAPCALEPALDIVSGCALKPTLGNTDALRAASVQEPIINNSRIYFFCGAGRLQCSAAPAGGGRPGHPGHRSNALRPPRRWRPTHGLRAAAAGAVGVAAGAGGRTEPGCLGFLGPT